MCLFSRKWLGTSALEGIYIHKNGSSVRAKSVSFANGKLQLMIIILLVLGYQGLDSCPTVENIDSYYISSHNRIVGGHYDSLFVVCPSSIKVARHVT